MNIQITEDKKIEIEMEDQLIEPIELFGEELEGKVTSPAQHHLFQVNENAEPLDENNQRNFSQRDRKTSVSSETSIS